MADVLDRLHETRARLRGVVAHADSAHRPLTRVHALTMSFDDIAVVLIAEPVDDSLTIADGSEWRPDPDTVSIPLNESDPWRLALGKPLFWSWSMTDQFGYRDGLQLAFAENVSDDSIIVQFIVLGSAIALRWVGEEYDPFAD
jgi:Family of unknown function (DUF6334)